MDIYCFYMMNGLTIFAQHDGECTANDYIIKLAVMVKINPQNPKEIGMQSAFPFSNQDESVPLNKTTVTAHTSLMYNPPLCTEYGNFWNQMAERAKAEKEAPSGIEIVPANAVIPGLGKPGLGVRPQGNRPRPPLKVI
jgi:hypothetical protein